MSTRKRITLGFLSPAYNEAENLGELHSRCRAAHSELQKEFSESIDLEFRMLVADNGSDDGSLAILEQLIREDHAIEVLANRTNYGVEASVGNLLAQAREFDLVVLMCADLQDPPELAISMVRELLQQPGLDAVLAVKQQSVGGTMLRLARRTYYRALGLSSRSMAVPRGFHGFGCYRQAVLEEAVRFWNATDMNARQCLMTACQSPLLLGYVQSDRLRGVSSYGSWGYWAEAMRALLSGDAAASRMALAIGSTGMAMAVLAGLFVLGNTLGGSSRYSGGVPTLIGIVLVSFALQMLMFAVLSRQIEGMRMGGLRRRVHFRRLSHEQ